jgi:outer membrane protein assembly factor BamB
MSLSALSPPATDFLTAWDTKAGVRIWTAEKPAAVSTMAAPVVSGGTVWAFNVEGYTSEGVLRGFDLTTGALLVERKMGNMVVDAALSRAGDTLYLAAENSVFYLIDAATGVVRKQLPLPGKLFSSPAVADGRAYVGCQDGKLYCIE